MLFQIQKEILHQKNFNLLKSIKHDVTQYKKLKKEYLRLPATAQKKLTPQLFVFMLLASIDYDDIDFSKKLIHAHDYDAMGTNEAKLALGRLFNKLEYCNEVIKYFLPLFDDGKLGSADLAILFRHLFERARHKDCHRLMKYVEEHYPNHFGWEVEVLDYQLKINHLYPTPKNIITEKLKTLYPRCKTSEEYYRMGDCFYKAGYFKDAVNMFDIALQKVKSSPTKDYKPLFDSSKCLYTMNDIITILESKDVKPFPIGGSLLGLVRDGKFMDYDKDADIGIFVNNYDEIFKIMTLICESPRFISSGMINSPKESHLQNIAILDVINGTTVDIFFFYHQSSYVEEGIYTICGTLKWQFSSFQLIRSKLAGKEYWVPDNVNLFFNELYGDWETPVEVWDSILNCPNLVPSSQPVVIYYSLMRLHNALHDGKIKQALNYYQTLITRWGVRFSSEADANIKQLLNLI